MHPTKLRILVRVVPKSVVPKSVVPKSSLVRVVPKSRNLVELSISRFPVMLSPPQPTLHPMTVALPQPRSPQPTPAAQDLAAVFATIDRHSCPTHYNFHLHTLRSDGQMHPRGLLQQAIAHGLTGLAITDHHTLAGYREAQQYRQDLQQDLQRDLQQDLQRNPQRNPQRDLQQDLQQDPQDDALVTPRALPSLWSGVEITAKLAGISVHILGYGFNVDAPELVPYTGGAEVHPSGQPFQAAEVIAALQAAGGLAVLAHPVRYRKPPEVLIPAAAKLGIDGVETFYAYDNPVPWRPSVAQTERVQQLGSSYGLFQTCGTDSHGPTLLQRL